MKKVVVILVVLTLVLSGLLAWRLKVQTDATAGPPGSSGIVEGTRILVSTRLGARIAAMHAVEGETVHAGDPLADLECTEPDAAFAEAGARVAAAEAQVLATAATARAVTFQVAAAERQARGARATAGAVAAQQRNARRQSDRAVALEGDNVLTRVNRENAETAAEDLSQRLAAATAGADAAGQQARALALQAEASAEQVRAAERQVEAGRAALERARALQAECRITAPADGIVTIRAREPGEVVLPGSTLYEITSYADTKVIFYVANADLSRVRPGMAVDVVADAWPDRSFSGRVLRVSAEAEFTPRTVQTRSDRDRLVYRVDARVANDEGLLRAGMPIEARVRADEATPPDEE
jgi:HlyD family secretion protein